MHLVFLVERIVQTRNAHGTTETNIKHNPNPTLVIGSYLYRRAVNRCTSVMSNIMCHLYIKTTMSVWPRLYIHPFHVPGRMSVWASVSDHRQKCDSVAVAHDI